MIGFELNNQLMGSVTQRKYDQEVTYTVYKTVKDCEDTVCPMQEVDRVRTIPIGQFVMLLNLYAYIIDNDIQNDFINPYGKNKEVTV